MEGSTEFKGIRNLRNTCFINSVMQVLLCIPPLRHFFKDSSLEPQDCLFNHFKNFISKYSEAVDVIEDREFIKSCYSLFPSEVPFTQQDAQEFFCLLIENLAGVLERRQEENIFNTLFGIEVTRNAGCKLNKGEDDQVYEKSYQLILSICNIKASTLALRSNAEVNFLNGRSNSCFCYLFRDKDPLTISDCIREYFTNFQESRTEQCRYCSTDDCVEEMGIKKYPEYLFLCLKRFEFNKGIIKVNKKVYPMERIELEKGKRKGKGKGKGKGKIEYELFSVIEHRQRFGRLHYFAYCKNEKVWAKCNDDDVGVCNWKSVENSQPYILGYKKIVKGENEFKGRNFLDSDMPSNRI